MRRKSSTYKPPVRLKILVLEYCMTELGVLFRISQQTKTGKAFGKDVDTFQAKNGFILSSQSYPEISSGGRLNVRGYTTRKDNYILSLTKSFCENFREEFCKIKDAVHEYNMYFNDLLDERVYDEFVNQVEKDQIYNNGLILVY